MTGARPLGWNSRSFPSVHTRALVAEEGGFAYYSDPCNDDLPYFVEEGGHPLLVVPYSKTTNDSRYLVSPGSVVRVTSSTTAGGHSTTCAAKPRSRAAR